MKKQIQLITICLTVCVLTTVLFVSNQVSFAQTAETNENETAPEATSATTQSLKERIEKVVEEKESRSNGQAVTEHTTRGIVGQVERLSEGTITINNAKGSVIVPITDQVEIVKGTRTIKVTEIEIENSVIALGLQAGESFTPVKIIVSTRSLLPRTQVVQLGAMSSLERNSLTLTTRADQQAVTFTINNSTAIEDASGEKISQQDLFEDVQLLVAGYVQESQTAGESSNVAQLIRALVEVE